MATQVKLLKDLSLIVVAVLAITLALPLSVIGEEVITLTTIMPGQDTLRVRRGVVGVDWRKTATLSNDDIGDNNLLIRGNVGIGTTEPLGILHVESSDGTDFVIDSTNGNVGIGTTSPQSPAPDGNPGNLDVNDVYLRSTGQWVSSSVGWRYDSGWTTIPVNLDGSHGTGKYNNRDANVFVHGLGSSITDLVVLAKSYTYDKIKIISGQLCNDWADTAYTSVE